VGQGKGAKTHQGRERSQDDSASCFSHSFQHITLITPTICISEVNPVINTNAGNHWEYDQVEEIKIKPKNYHNTAYTGQGDREGDSREYK